MDSDNVSLHVGSSKIDERNTSKKYDSLFSESQPVFQCIALVDYESPEKLKVQEGDLIQIWLPTLNDGNSTSDSTTTTTTTTTATTDTSSAISTEWWYASKQQELNGPIYGWIPSNICEKI